MNNKKEKRKDSVRPSDETIWHSSTMYDNMPYVWDPDLNSEHIFRRVTGNLIKAYRCNIQEPFELKHE